MNRIDVCKSCDASITERGFVTCSLILNKGKLCHRLLMARIFGREDGGCPHPSAEQREKFAAAEIPEPPKPRTFDERLAAMSKVTEEKRRELRRAPQSRQQTLAQAANNTKNLPRSK